MSSLGCAISRTIWGPAIVHFFPAPLSFKTEKYQKSTGPEIALFLGQLFENPRTFSVVKTQNDTINDVKSSVCLLVKDYCFLIFPQ